MHRLILIAALALGLLATSCAERKLPDSFHVELQTLDGARFKLADHADQPFLLIFWTSDCSACVEISKRAQSALAAEKVGAVFLVFVEPQADAEAIREAAKVLGLAGVIVADPELRLVQALEIETHPALVYVTPEANEVKLQREYDLSPDAAGRLVGGVL